MFYQLKIKENLKKVPDSVLGFPVKYGVSTYVETTRDLVAEADKKKIKSITITPCATLPERGEDGNAPTLIKLGDHGQNTAAPAEDEATDEA